LGSGLLPEHTIIMAGKLVEAAMAKAHLLIRFQIAKSLPTISPISDHPLISHTMRSYEAK
jgi:hypothetical protein